MCGSVIHFCVITQVMRPAQPTTVVRCCAMTDGDLEALAILRADICKLFPPGPVRERWLAWAELVAAPDQRLQSETISPGRRAGHD